MFYVNTDDEDGEFSITPGGSKLANLFSSDQTNPEKQSPSLTYTAPKQPKKTDGQTSGGGTFAVLHAVAVHAYKFVNQQYSSQGKLGAALIGCHETAIYRILLYKGKQQQVTVASLSATFPFKIQANNYANFYDDKRENWSIMFESGQNAVEFCKQVAVAKANSAGEKLSGVLIQELALGDGQDVDMGDAIEIKYTGWLLTNYTFGKEFDCNANSEKLFRMKIGKTKVIKGWEEGLLGTKKNSRRLLIVPPPLGYGDQGIPDKIPPNATLIYDVFVNKVKLSTGTGNTSRSSTPSTLDSDTQDGRRERVLTGASAEDTVKSRSASLSEQMSNSPKSEKAKIISRMAKMGMPMLPMHGAIPAQPSSESDMEEEAPQTKAHSSQPPRTSSPKLPPKPRTSSFTQPPASAEQVQAPLAGLTPIHQVAVIPNPQQYNPGIPFGYPFQQAGPMTLYQQPSFQNSPIADPHLPILLSETRTQNSEIRMALGKISEKVDTLGSKIQEVQGGNQNFQPYMESATLLQNIQRIVQENSKLKDELGEKNAKIQTLNEKVCTLLERNHKFVEESNLLLERKSDSLHSTTAQSQGRLITLEQERVKLSSELSEALSTITSLQLELQRKEHSVRQRLLEANGETDKHQQDIDSLQLMVKDLESQVNNLTGNLNKSNQERDDLRTSLDTLKSELSALKLSKHQLEQNLSEEGQLLEKLRHETDENQLLKDQYQNELEILKSELNKERNREDADWMSAKANLSDQLSSVLKEKQVMQTVISELQEQVESLRLTQESEKKVSNLWKTKCEKLQASIAQLKEESKRHMGGSLTAAQHQDFEFELKRAMTGLYRSLQRELVKEGQYSGSDILKTILAHIRLVTAALIEARHSTVTEDEHDKKDNSVSIKGESQEQVPKPSIPENNSSPTLSNQVPVNEVCAAEDLLTPKTEDTRLEFSSIIEVVENEQQSMENIQEATVLDHSNNSESVSDKPNPEGASEVELKDVTDSAVTKSEEQVQENQVNMNVNCNTDKTSEKSSNNSTPSKAEIESATNKVCDDTLESADDPKKKYLFFDKTTKTWRPQPPPPPLFDDDEDEDDWLK